MSAVLRLDELPNDAPAPAVKGGWEVARIQTLVQTPDGLLQAIEFENGITHVRATAYGRATAELVLTTDERRALTQFLLGRH